MKKVYFAMWLCYHSMPLTRPAVDWSAVCDCGIPHHTHLLFKLTFSLLIVIMMHNHSIENVLP